MPIAVVGDLSGNVFVAGEAAKAVVTGYTRSKSPVYSYQYHWLVRKSGNGGVSWSVDDDYQLASSANAFPQGMGTDLAGNVYVVGGANDANNLSHAIIRTNSGGTWATVDDYVTPVYGAQYISFTVDSNGKLYAGGQDDNWWLIRSTSGPATATSGSFSATAISSSKSVRDPLLNLIS
jgi:hypothetical protein